METNHLAEGELGRNFRCPETLPLLTEDDFVKGHLSDGEDRHCYTGWLLEIFLSGPYYVEAYKEFRLKTMDLMYKHYSEDHAVTPKQRSELFNMCAKELGYVQRSRVSF